MHEKLITQKLLCFLHSRVLKIVSKALEPLEAMFRGSTVNLLLHGTVSLCRAANNSWSSDIGGPIFAYVWQNLNCDRSLCLFLTLSFRVRKVLENRGQADEERVSIDDWFLCLTWWPLTVVLLLKCYPECHDKWSILPKSTFSLLSSQASLN